MSADKRLPATRVKAGTLLAVLKDLEKIVAPRDTIPVLGFVLLSVADGKLSATATNLDMWGERDCATDDRDGPGGKEWLESVRPFTVLLPAKHLRKVVAEFDSEAMVTIDASEANGKAGRAVISAGRAKFRLNAADPEEFPRVPPL